MIERLNLAFYGGVGAVTGANFMIDYGGEKFLVDCGLVQGGREVEESNFRDFAYDPKQVGHLFVTHAHLDHVGRIPRLVQQGFRGKIVSTIETKKISRLALLDAYKVMLSRRERGERILYEEGDINTAFELWEGISYESSYRFDGIDVELKDAGHILGSAMFVFNINSKKIAFTGDIGNSPSPLLKDRENLGNVDYLVMESVYGDRNHEAREMRGELFKKTLLEAIKRGGEIVIPAFSIEKTQIVLSELDNMIERKELPSVPVFLDSPLAAKVTEIYKQHSDRFNDAVQSEIKRGDDIFSFPRFEIALSKNDSTQIHKRPNPKIIIAGSGMSEGGRVRNHEVRALPDPKSTILLTGFQPIGTLGRKLEEGIKKVFIDGEAVKVRAQIKKIRGYSGHADSDQLLDFVDNTAEGGKINPDALNSGEGRGADLGRRLKIFVCMGEPKASLFLIQRIRDYLNLEAVYPEAGKSYELT